MKNGLFTVTGNEKLRPSVMLMKLRGDTSDIKRPGQFVNIKIDGLFLRRPISVCDLDGDELTIIYKTVGRGTEKMSLMEKGEKLDLLTGLGNGFDTSLSGNRPLLIGGGVGTPPLYLLAKRLREEDKTVSVVLGFNTADEVFFEDRFRALGCAVTVTTADGSAGAKGFATDALPEEYSCFYACGPEPMLKAVFKKTAGPGQLSFEERMGCGFGACMGCSCKTVTGYKRICKEGPVLFREEIIWED